MKKLFIILIVLMNAIFFFSIDYAYKEKEVSDIYNDFNIATLKHSKFIEFDSDIINVNQDVFYESLVQISRNHNVTILFNDDDYLNNIYNLYCLSNQDIVTDMNLVTSKDIKFNNSNNASFYTAGDNLFLLNKQYTYHIYPLSMMFDNGYSLNSTFKFIGTSESQVTSAINDLSQKLPDYPIMIRDYVNDQFDINSYISNTLGTLLIVSSSLILICLLYIINERLSKVAILKLNGYSDTMIVTELFIHDFVIFFISIILTFSTLFFISYQAINYKTVEIIKMLFNVLILETVVLIGLYFVSILIIKLMSIPLLLKNYRFERMMLIINGVAKISILLITFPILINGTIDSDSVIKGLMNHVTNENKLSNITYISSFKKGWIDNQYDPALYLMNKTDPNYIKYASIVDEIDKIGGVFFSMNTKDINGSIYTEIRANHNYLTINEMYDVNGLPISNTIKDGSVYVLIPQRYKDIRSIEKYFITESNPTEVIYTMNDQTPLSIAFVNSFNKFDVKDPFLIIYGKNTERYDKAMFNNYYIVNDMNKSDYNTFLDEYGYKDKFEIKESKDTLKANFNSMIILLKDHLIVLLLSLSLLVIQSVQYMNLYVNSEYERIKSKQLLGYPKYIIFGNMMLESLMIYLIPIILFSKLSLELVGMYTVVFVIVELIVLQVIRKRRLV